MLEKGKISTQQAVLLMVMTVRPTAILFLPSITSEFARQDAWLSLLLATLMGILFTLMLVSLMNRFPRQTLIQYSEDILGKFFGKMVGLAYIWFFLHTNAIIIREYGDFLTTVFLPQTPLLVFNITVMILAVQAVRHGIEPMARLTGWLFILTSTILVFLFFLNIHLMDLQNLLPVLERGFGPVIRGSLHPAAWFGEIIVLSMIFPFLSSPSFRKGRNIVLTAVMITAFFLTLLLVQSISIFGPQLTARFTFPIIELARMVTLGEFFERIEALVMIVWVGGVFIKISVFHYVTVMAAAQWFNLKDYRPLAIPLGILAVILSETLFKGTTELLNFLAVTFPIYALSIFQVGLPALLLVTAVIRKKGVTKNDK